MLINKKIFSCIVLVIFSLVSSNSYSQTSSNFNNKSVYSIEKNGDTLNAKIENGFFELDNLKKNINIFNFNRKLLGALPLKSADTDNVFLLNYTISKDKQHLTLNKNLTTLKPLPKNVKLFLEQNIEMLKEEPKNNSKNKQKPKPKKDVKPKRFIPETEKFWNAIDQMQRAIAKNPIYSLPVYGSASIGSLAGAFIGQFGSLISVPFILIPIIGPLIFFPVASISLYSAFAVLGALLGFGVGARIGASITLDPELNISTQELLNKIITSNGIPFPTSN